MILTCLESLCVNVRPKLSSHPILTLIFLGSEQQQQQPRRFIIQTSWKWLHSGGAPLCDWRGYCAFYSSFSSLVASRVMMLFQKNLPERYKRIPIARQTPRLIKRLSPSSPSTMNMLGRPLRSLCGSSWPCSWNLVSVALTKQRNMNKYVLLSWLLGQLSEMI